MVYDLTALFEIISFSFILFLYIKMLFDSKRNQQ